MVDGEMVEQARAAMPGTCGELVQGRIDGRDFLVSCPVDMWSELVLYSDHEQLQQNQLQMGFQSARDMTTEKISKAIECVKSLWKQDGGSSAQKQNYGFSMRMQDDEIPQFTRNSSLIPGKGMGSSTADIVAAYYAACLLWSRKASESEAADIALQIEPSDSTMFSQMTVFDHVHGYRREQIGNAPEADIIMIDPGGFVDTVVFHRAAAFQKTSNMHRESQIYAEQVRLALQYVVDGIHSMDIEKIAEGATISAFANQALLPKRHLGKVLEFCKQLGGLGINIAHSGTVIGILLERGRISGEEAQIYVKKRYPEWEVYPTTLISGGVRLGRDGIRSATE